MSNTKQTPQQPTTQHHRHHGYNAFRKRSSKQFDLDVLFATRDFSTRTGNCVKDLVRRYNTMTTNYESNKNLHTKINKNQQNINISLNNSITDTTEDNVTKKTKQMNFQGGESIRHDASAFQITSAKHRGSMNQIEPNIVKRRVNAINERQTTTSSINSSLVDNKLVKDLRNIINHTNISFDLKTSSEDDSEEFLGNTHDMYEQFLKNGRKKVFKKVQQQIDHQELVKFYRNLFARLSQIPFAIAVVYCTIFFIVKAFSLFYTYIYSS